MSLTTRRARAADVPRILELLAEDTIGPNEGLPTDDAVYAKAFALIDADPNQLLLVGELDGRCVATLQLTFVQYLAHRGGVLALVEAVRVADEARSAGHGAALMKEAIDEAKRRGCVRVQLTSNKQRVAAKRFYERLGFVASHNGFKLDL